jgi:hypothetical protein
MFDAMTPFTDEYLPSINGSVSRVPPSQRTIENAQIAVAQAHFRAIQGILK